LINFGKHTIKNKVDLKPKLKSFKRLLGYNYYGVEQLMVEDELFVNSKAGNSTAKIAKILPITKKQISYTITKLSLGKSFIVDGVIAGIEEIREIVVLEDTKK